MAVVARECVLVHGVGSGLAKAGGVGEGIFTFEGQRASGFEELAVVGQFEPCRQFARGVQGGLFAMIDQDRVLPIVIILCAYARLTGIGQGRLDDQFVERIDLIFQLASDIHIPGFGLLGRVVGAGIGGGVGILGLAGLAFGIVERMVERHIACHDQIGLIVNRRDLVVEIDISVRTQALAPSDTAVGTVAEESSPSSASHQHLVGVVRTADDGGLTLVEHDVGEQVDIVPKIIAEEMFGAIPRGGAIGGVAIVEPASVGGHHIRAQATGILAKEAFLAVFLEREIDDMFRFVVIEARQLGHIAFLLNDLHFFDHVSRDILGGRLHIVAKKLLAIDAYAFDVLAVDGHVALFVHRHTVHLLQQVLHHRVLTQFVGGGVELDRIAFDGHLCRMTLHFHFAQYMYIFLQFDGR